MHKDDAQKPIWYVFLFTSGTITERETVLVVKPTVSIVLKLQHFTKYYISLGFDKKCGIAAVDISLVWAYAANHTWWKVFSTNPELILDTTEIRNVKRMLRC